MWAKIVDAKLLKVSARSLNFGLCFQTLEHHFGLCFQTLEHHLGGLCVPWTSPGTHCAHVWLLY